MARERVKNKRKGGDEKDETEKLSKLQMKVVNWVRKNVPTKKTKFEHSHVVEYFSAAKALDALMKDSPWAPEKAKEGSELRFEFREQAIDYMGELLRQHMFHRARKVAVAEKEKKKKKEETEDEEPEKPTKKSKKDEKKVKFESIIFTVKLSTSGEGEGEREEEEKDQAGDALRPGVPGWQRRVCLAVRPHSMVLLHRRNSHSPRNHRSLSLPSLAHGDATRFAEEINKKNNLYKLLFRCLLFVCCCCWLPRLHYRPGHRQVHHLRDSLHRHAWQAQVLDIPQPD